VSPFKALRPTPERASAVAAVPYDVVTTAEARALAEEKPLSFLHVSRAEIDLPPATNPYDDAVYRTAVANFNHLRAAAPLVVEEAPSLYFYRLVMGGHAQTGLAGCFSIEEYDRGVIRRHERTRKDKEDDRTRHIIDLRAQTGPVFLTYPEAAEVDRLAQAATAAPALFDFIAEDGIAHTLWRVPADMVAPLVEVFARIPVLYIADGHHRAASARRAAETLDGASAEAGTFLAVAFPHTQAQILPYHRVVKDLNGQSASAFLDALSARLRVEAGEERPCAKGEVAMYLDGRWYRVALAPPREQADAAARLDVSLLQDQVLGPLLGIGDQRTDPRIDFVGGIRGPSALVRAVDEGRAAVAFALFPVSVSDLMAIADAGGIMPPKSTWFEPKLRDGLLTHLI
jgi:uncharacterized protein (DUF1015 family)